MDNSPHIGKMLGKIIRKITPKNREKTQQQKIASAIMEKINKTNGSHKKAELVGSMSRNTNLAGDNDIDIFVFYPQEMAREKFEKEGLALAKKIFKNRKYEIAYSEHPYVRGEINGHEVEIVPTYMVENAADLKSAVDRSPFHNAYLKGKFDAQMQAQARLMKQFMKGVKCYGADLSANSFPGYVAELLILRYGGFVQALKAASDWQKEEVVDIESFHTQDEAREKFRSHLIVIDPVDKNRNVAAALSENQYARFIAASRAFLQKPSPRFFFPKNILPWPKKKLSAFLQKTEIVAIQLAYPKGVIEDQAWGQLRRLARKISSMAEQNDFTVKRTGEWVEKNRHMVIALELESRVLQKSKVRVGPEIVFRKNSESFLSGHTKPLSGPRIENGKWVVEVERKHTNIADFLGMLLKKIRKEEKNDVKSALAKTKILEEKSLAKLHAKNRNFAQFFTQWLKGKEEFLEY